MTDYLEKRIREEFKDRLSEDKSVLRKKYDCGFNLDEKTILNLRCDLLYADLEAHTLYIFNIIPENSEFDKIMAKKQIELWDLYASDFFDWAIKEAYIVWPSFDIPAEKVLFECDYPSYKRYVDGKFQELLIKYDSFFKNLLNLE